MRSTEVFFESPALLLLLIPAAALVIAAYRLMRGAAVRRPEDRAALVLRLLEAVLLTLILSGLTVVTYSTDTTTVFLVDRSDSMAGVREETDAFVQEAKERLGGTSVVVEFAAEPAEEGALLNPGATDIAAAIDAAVSRLPQDTGKRVVLLSDGQATDGDAPSAARAAAGQGVRLDAVRFDTAVAGPETELTALELPADAAEGQRVSAGVTAVSSAKTQGVLRIYDGSASVYEEAVAVLPGENTFTCALSASGLGPHVFRAELEADVDTLTQNNSSYACMNVTSGEKILLVDGTGQEAQKLAALLEQAGDSVTVVASGEAPQTVSAMCEYGLIVLMNVDAGDLPEGSAQKLEEYVREYGRSVLTTGGENTYIYGGMKDTPFETLLPVRMSVEEKESVDPVALMLVIDITDSMTRQSAGTPIEMARRGAIKCVDALNANDYAGVITFSDEAQVLVEMTSMQRKDEVLDAINGIDTVGPDRLTKFSGALRTACDTLKAFDGPQRRHVMFITDGSPADANEGFEQIVREMRANDITLSTIVVGRIVNVVKLLENLSAIGGGRCYLVESAQDLSDIMSMDTVLSQVEYTIRDPFKPQIGLHASAFTDEEAVAQLYGYIRTGAKGSASVELSTPEGRPIYALWDYGTGRAASFMSDLSGDWSRTWFANERGQAMIVQMIHGLIPETLSQSAVDLQLEAGGARGVLRLANERADAETVLAQVCAPDGQRSDVQLCRGEDGFFTGETPLGAPGRYDVTLTWLNAQGETIDTRETAVVYSWSGEYEALLRQDGGVALMELSACGGGAVVTTVEELAAIELSPMAAEHDAALPLALAVFVCLMADIVIRRTKLKRLSSWLTRRKTP